jgi:hypothetical protein
VEEGRHGGQTDVSKKPLTPEDIRFTQAKDGGTLYAIVLEIPKDGNVLVKSLAAGSHYWSGQIGGVRLVGGGNLEFTRDETGLHVSLPEGFTGKIAFALELRPGPAADKSAGKKDAAPSTQAASRPTALAHRRS